jgi:hypothetical protein
MVTTRTGDGWTVEVDDGVMIWEFLPEMDISEFGSEALETYEELLETETVDGMVTVVGIDDPFNADVFEVWERSAKRADRAGIDRWAVVADGVKALSLRGKVDTGDLETLTTEDRVGAVEWARGE